MIEPLNHPVWAKRCRCLASLFSGPMLATELVRFARKLWGWSEAMTWNVLAAGEGSSWRSKGATWTLVHGAAVDTDPWHAAQLSGGGRARPRATFKPKACLQCTQDFIPTGHRQSFCSSRCKARYRSRSAA